MKQVNGSRGREAAAADHCSRFLSLRRKIRGRSMILSPQKLPAVHSAMHGSLIGFLPSSARWHAKSNSKSKNKLFSTSMVELRRSGQSSTDPPTGNISKTLKKKNQLQQHVHHQQRVHLLLHCYCCSCLSAVSFAHCRTWVGA